MDTYRPLPILIPEMEQHHMDFIENTTKIDPNMIWQIVISTTDSSTEYNSIIDILLRRKERHVNLKSNIPTLLKSKYQPEVLAIAIIMNDIAYVKIMIDGGLDKMDSHIPRNNSRSLHIGVCIVVDSRTYILDMLLASKKIIFKYADGELMHAGDRDDLLGHAIVDSRIDILHVLSKYIPNSCDGYIQLLHAQTAQWFQDNKYINDDLLQRFTFAIKFQKPSIDSKDIAIITLVIKYITPKNSRLFIEQFIDAVCIIPDGCGVCLLYNKETFEYSLKYFDENALSKSLKSITLDKSIMEKHNHIFDYFVDHNTEFALKIYFYTMQFEYYNSKNISANESGHIFDMIEKLLKHVKSKDLLEVQNMKLDTREIDINVTLNIICKYDYGTIMEIIKYIPEIKQDLYKHINRMIKTDRADLIEYIINSGYNINVSTKLHIISNDVRVTDVNKYICKSAKYRSWKIFEYLVGIISMTDIQKENVHRYAAQFGYMPQNITSPRKSPKYKSYKSCTSYISFISKEDVVDMILHSSYESYIENRMDVLYTIKNILNLLLNACRPFPKNITFQQIKCYGEIIPMYESWDECISWIGGLLGHILPYDTTLIDVYSMMSQICHRALCVYESQTEIEFAHNLIEIYIDKISHHLDKHRNGIKNTINLINSCMKHGMNRNLKKYDEKYVLYISKTKAEDVIPDEPVFNIKKYICKLKYPIELPHYERFHRALESCSDADVHPDHICLVSPTIKIYIRGSGPNHMKKISYYATNIYSEGKDDIRHIFDFGIDRHIHKLGCRIVFANDRIFEDKKTEQAFFNGYIMVDGEIINGVFEYFTNCFGVVFHRLFRPSK